MVVRVDVAPAVITWAKERSGIEDASLARRFPRVADWERGEASPTLKQLEAFAEATHTPIGFLARRP